MIQSRLTPIRRGTSHKVYDLKIYLMDSAPASKKSDAVSATLKDSGRADRKTRLAPGWCGRSCSSFSTGADSPPRMVGFSNSGLERSNCNRSSGFNSISGQTLINPVQLYRSYSSCIQCLKLGVSLKSRLRYVTYTFRTLISPFLPPFPSNAAGNSKGLSMGCSRVSKLRPVPRCTIASGAFILTA